MMHDFLANNCDEPIARCKAKVSLRLRRHASDDQRTNGVPPFLKQLTRTLAAEQANNEDESLRISGPSGGQDLAASEIGLSAAVHGKKLPALGFSMDQVVHDYCDLCQAITELVHEKDAPFRGLVDSSLPEVRAHGGIPIPRSIFSLAALIQDARTSAQLEAETRGCVLLVAAVDPILRVEANRDLLLGSSGNLLSNAFKFTHRHTAVNLAAYALGDYILIDVEDRCGGLAANYAEAVFTPFSQLGDDITGLGLGLSVAQHNIESMGGTVTVRNVAEVGCVFTISLPNSTVERRIQR